MHPRPDPKVDNYEMTLDIDPNEMMTGCPVCGEGGGTVQHGIYTFHAECITESSIPVYLGIGIKDTTK